ncbi:hypothetical protein EP837_03813 (plasmid) [Sphingobium sp. EP60837]|nr:hypothetical protein EP837_03813 [Sphingobium sp. EP60837]
MESKWLPVSVSLLLTATPTAVLGAAGDAVLIDS